MFDCEALSGQKKNSWRFPPGALPNLNAMCLSIRTKLPGDISKSKSEVFVGQNRFPWQYLPVLMRGVCRSELKFLAILPNFDAWRFSVKTKIPGDSYQFGRVAFFRSEPKFRGNYQFECEVFVGQNRNSWRYLPSWMRGVCRSEPRFLAMFPSLNAKGYSARTGIPGDIPQFK